jgi:hypothetical protein
MEQKSLIRAFIDWAPRRAADGVIAILWHFWMILTCRAQVVHVGDRFAPIAVFFCGFVCMGLLRWVILNDLGFALVVFNLVAYLLILRFATLLYRPRLLALALATSAAVDLGCIVLQLVGVPAEILRDSFWYELILMVVLVIRYRLWAAAYHPAGAQQ